MNRVLIVGEDDLCCAIGARLVEYSLPGWSLVADPIAVGGITKLIPRLPRYGQLALYGNPVICIADTDGVCPIELLQQWLPRPKTERFVFRLAHAEAESWVLADRVGFASYFGISAALLPITSDTLEDPKREVLRLAARSRHRAVRDEVVSRSDRSKRGSGYNLHLCSFVKRNWSIGGARDVSESLDRACNAIAKLADVP